jgi:hypothetical protein
MSNRYSAVDRQIDIVNDEIVKPETALSLKQKKRYGNKRLALTANLKLMVGVCNFNTLQIRPTGGKVASANPRDLNGGETTKVS